MVVEKTANDDYVKFIRYAEFIADRSENSIVAYICPHGFLDNPTFRGMRWSLLNSFSQLFILNLHGNSKRKETCPDGSKDENVFDIMQGVCILLGVKRRETKNKIAEVYLSDIYGLRDTKYNYLSTTKWESVDFKRIEVIEPYYYFSDRDYSLKDEYDSGFAVNELFKLNGVGITTAHDEFVISSNKNELLERFGRFKASVCDDTLYDLFEVKRKNGWDIKEGWQNLQNASDLSKYIYPIAYRPFDVRYIFYEDKLVWRTARKTMNHMILGDNIALVTVNRQPEKMPVGYYFVTENMLSNGYIRSDSVSIDTLLPLYTYKNSLGKIEKTHNLDLSIIGNIEDSIGMTFCDEKTDDDNCFSPQDVFDYVYAVLYCQSYREKYEEYLKTEFARIPYPNDKATFWQLVEYGKQLRSIHLHPKCSIPDVKLEGKGDNLISISPSKAFDNGRVYINKGQYFKDVDLSIWEMYIGGYQPLQKWLKDNKGIVVTDKEQRHFYEMVYSLSETQMIMKKIEEIMRDLL